MADNEERVKCYFIWQWEYQRRNVEYKKAFYDFLTRMQELIKGDDISEDTVEDAVRDILRHRMLRMISNKTLAEHLRQQRPVCIPNIEMLRLSMSKKKERIDDDRYKTIAGLVDDFEKIFSRRPKSPSKGLDLEAIIQCIQKNKTVQSNVEFFDAHQDKITTIVKNCGTKVAGKPSDANRKLVLEIDLNMREEIILGGVSYFYKTAKRIFNSIKIDEVLIADLISLIDPVVQKQIRQLSGSWFKIDNKQRAAGLWMYDYLKANNVGQDKAIHAFEAFTKRKIKTECFLDKDERTLKFYINETGKCINKMEVLAISGYKKSA